MKTDLSSPVATTEFFKFASILSAFRYGLNQIPYGYTVEVRNRFKGLYLIDREPEELWTEVSDTVQEAGIKTIPKKRKAKRQNGGPRRPYKQLRREEELKAEEKRERYTHLNAEFQRVARRHQKAILSDQCEEIKKAVEWERLEISSRKLEIPREHFMQR